MQRLRRAIQRLFIAGISFMLAVAPLTARANSMPTLDSLWNEPQGLSMDSALYVFQAWFGGYSDQMSSDPSQRGFEELSRANTDLLNAYTLLQHAHQGGPQPVAIIDPLLAGAYDGVTGSDGKAPVAELFASINQGLLALEGRESTTEQVAALLEESRAMQAAGLRDLETGGSGHDALIASNAQREADFLTQVQRVATPEDDLASLLAAATLQATTVAHHQSLTALAALGNGKRNGQATSNASGNGHANGHDKGHGQQQANGSGKKK
ncbi:MAG TPA: hypothetical protein VIT43_00235 [Candidatus Dormibacteraeota bacterium]